MKQIIFGLVACVLMGGFGFADFSALTYVPGKRVIGGRMSSIDMQKVLDASYVIIPAAVRKDKPTAQGHAAIRQAIIKQVLTKGIAQANGAEQKLTGTKPVLKFVSQPYTWNANYALTVRGSGIVTTDITAQDDLDLIINNAFVKLGAKTETIVFSKTDLQALGPVYLRKSAADLKALGYEVVSSRYRTNYDAAYRRHNIVTAFGYLGHIRVLNPGDSFQYLGSIHYDPKYEKNYKNGLAIVQDDEIPVYGGGICGGSTAAYQGFITNLGLKLDARNHSKRYSDLYTATINGQKITTPGIDATVFAGAVDLKVTNISNHPIIVVLNYNGNYGGIEETMSLGLAQDRGSLEFLSKKVSSQTKTKTNPNTGSGYTETVRTGCYTWKINGKNKTSCYREIH